MDIRETVDINDLNEIAENLSEAADDYTRQKGQEFLSSVEAFGDFVDASGLTLHTTVEKRDPNASAEDKPAEDKPAETPAEDKPAEGIDAPIEGHEGQNAGLSATPLTDKPLEVTDQQKPADPGLAQMTPSGPVVLAEDRPVPNVTPNAGPDGSDTPAGDVQDASNAKTGNAKTGPEGA